ncbi:MAG: hypothetical protein BGN86_05230 [Caulobacterales bacterium 68-7]|nr:hypothetical protein [Caulobacterales bacterium]OJU13808.1 MAG: hypothetical protein BGN86_05230 [Caulobacterales bacterium 68-7]
MPFECRVDAGVENGNVIYAALAQIDLPQEQRRAAECVMAHPEIVDPAAFAFLAQSLWMRGDRLQATFWFYMFQARTRPWVRQDREMAQGRAALSGMIGGPINAWISSDREAVIEVASRAIAYEAHAPLYAGRPDGVTATDWLALIAREREAYDTEFRRVAASDLFKPGNWEAARRERGLPVGPLDKPGAPLLDTWR